MLNWTRRFSALILAVLMFALVACENNQNEAADPVVVESRDWLFTDNYMEIPSLRDTYKDDFDIGFGIDYNVLDRYDGLLAKHAGGVTPGNSMKPNFIQQIKGKYTFERGDTLLQYAEKHSMSVHGHTLVWHSQTPAWFTTDNQGKDLSREEALTNMRAHIQAVVGHYKGKVAEWDVVNEAISDSDGSVLRADSPWYRVVGEDYIKLAFQYAHEADPDAILYYNDYNIEEPGKRARTITMLKKLLAEGVPIHGVGIQGHWSLDYPSYSDIRSAIKEYADLGLKVQITELDISMYAHNDQTRYTEPPEALLEKQADRYQKLFDIFRENKEAISRISIWGIADDDTWLDNFPVQNRKNWPLLFDEQHGPKESFWRVVQEPVLSKLTVESGKLMMPFENGRLNYVVKADEGAKEIQLKPVALDQQVTIQVEGGDLTESGIVIPITNDHTQVSISVEGYGKSHIYEIHIVREMKAVGWEFDEGSGSSVGDFSIFGIPGTLHDVEWTTGVKGTGLSFKSTDSYADLGLGDRSLFNDGDFSISVWVKPEQVNKNQALLWYGSPTAIDAKLWRLKLTDDGAIYFQLQRPIGKEDKLGSQFLTTEPNVLPANEWTHIVATRKGESLQIYVNGEIKASQAFGYIVDISGANAPLLAGKDKDNNGNDYTGELDSLSIYPYALEQEAAQEIFGLIKGETAK